MLLANKEMIAAINTALFHLTRLKLQEQSSESFRGKSARHRGNGTDIIFSTLLPTLLFLFLTAKIPA